MKYIVLILITMVLIWPCRVKEYFVLGEPEGDGEILSPSEVAARIYLTTKKRR